VSDYTRGPTYARSDRPTFEYKASAPGSTGGGYPRVRSCEHREHTARQNAEDVYVAIHRLAAVAWHLGDGTLGEDVHLSDMDGMDVHHQQPDSDRRGMPSANGEDWTVLVSHGSHASITQSQMRAWAEDAKDSADDEYTKGDRCVRCNADPDVPCQSADWDGVACVECAQRLSDGAEIEVL